MDAEARLGRQVVDAVDAGEEAVLLPRRVAEPGEDGEDLLGVDDQAGAAVLVVGAEDRSRVRVAQLRGDQLEPGRVRHQRIPPHHRIPAPRVGGVPGPSGPVDSAARATAWRARP